MSYADGLLSTGERITHRNKQHPFVFIWGARYTILALIIAAVLFWVRSNVGQDGLAGTLNTHPRLGGGDPVLRWPRGLRLDGAPLHQPGVRADEPPGHPGRGRAQPPGDRQLAREDQRCGPDPVDLRADVRLRRPDRPDRGRDRDRALQDDPRPDRVQEGDARREARVRGRHGALRLGARPADPRGRRRRRERPGTGGRATAGGGAAAAAARLRRRPRPGADARPGHSRADPDEVTRTLASLADLRDRGAITAEEYESKKADLLGRL